MLKRFLLPGVVLLYAPVSFSQGVALNDTSVTRAEAYYHAATGPNSPIYTGTEHLGYLPSIKGTAYFGEGGWVAGSVMYQGILYPDVNLMYDQVGGVLVLRHPNGVPIELFSPRVSWFSIGNTRFVRITGEEAEDAPPEGFYQLIVDGPISVLARKQTRIKEDVSSGQIEREFVNNYDYYALKNGEFHFIRNQGSIMGLTEENRKEVAQYLRNNHIKYRRDREYAIRVIAEQYNKLSR